MDIYPIANDSQQADQCDIQPLTYTLYLSTVVWLNGNLSSATVDDKLKKREGKTELCNFQYKGSSI